MLYSYKNQWPTQLPYRIKLSDGRTRTDPRSFTQQEILDAGYVPVENSPTLLENQWLSWSGTEWIVNTKTQEQIEEELRQKLETQWEVVRKKRDLILSSFDWRFIRYESQVRLGITPTDNLTNLDNFTQALRDVTLQEDPFNIVWPIFETTSLENEEISEE